MATDTRDASIHDEQKGAEEAPAPEETRSAGTAERWVVPAATKAVETPREARRAKREQARARKRADAAAKRANMAYAEAAAALRALDDASRKVEGADAPEPVPAPEPEAVTGAEPASATASTTPSEPSAPATPVEPVLEAAQAPSVTAPQVQPAASAVAPQPQAPAVAVPAAAVQPAAVPAATPVAPAPQPVAAAPVATTPQPAAPPAASAVAPAPAAYAQPAPVAAAPPQPIPQYVFVEPPRRTGRTVAIVIMALLLMAALAAAGWFGYRYLFGPHDAAAPEDVPTAMGPIASLSGTPTATVSLRANAEGWAEEKSTPIIAYIRKVDDEGAGAPSSSAGASAGTTTQASAQAWEQGEAETTSLLFNARTNREDITYLADSSSASAAGSASGSSSASAASSASSGSSASSSSGATAGYEAYHAFRANVNETISLAPGRYTFTYITPLNEDGSLYKVPEVVDVAVGKDGTALLPVSLEKVAAADVTEEQAKQAAARIRTAMEKGDDSFSNAAFKTSFDKALTQWFAEKLKTEEERKREAEEAKKDEKKEDGASSSSSSSSSSSGGGASSTPSAPSTSNPAPNTTTQTHVHQWVRSEEQYWVPNVVVVSPAYWEDGTYHAAVWEDRGSYQARPIRHCSGCGATEAL